MRRLGKFLNEVNLADIKYLKKDCLFFLILSSKFGAGRDRWISQVTLVAAVEVKMREKKLRNISNLDVRSF